MARMIMVELNVHVLETTSIEKTVKHKLVKQISSHDPKQPEETGQHDLIYFQEPSVYF